MSTTKGPGERKIRAERFEEDAETWEYYNPALALVDGRGSSDSSPDEESAAAHDRDEGHGGHANRGC
jgi:hypothetical protein